MKFTTVMHLMAVAVLIFTSSFAVAEGPSAKNIMTEVRMEGEKQTDTQKTARTIYDEGFTLMGEDDSLKIGAWMQNDVRIFFKGHPSTTQFLVRRARLDFRGSLERIFGFRIMGEFEGNNGTNAANLKEGWVEYNQFPEFRMKIGQFKEPFGLENLYGDLWLDFMERPAVENFVRPEQDLGLMFFGKLLQKHVEYGVGLFNGSGTNVAESNDDKDVAARIAVTPFLKNERVWINHLTMGGSWSYGKQTETLDGTGPTTAGGMRFLSFVNPTAGADVSINDKRTRAGGDMEWFVGPFSAKGEYVFSRSRAVTFGGASRTWNLHGVSNQLTYLLTGEKKSNQQSVTPKKNFDPKEGGWGALELATRVEMGWSDQGLIDAGFAAGTDDLWSTSGGLNWYLNRHLKMMLNYIYTRFDDAVANAGGKTNEHLLLARVQFNL